MPHRCRFAASTDLHLNFTRFGFRALVQPEVQHAVFQGCFNIIHIQFSADGKTAAIASGTHIRRFRLQRVNDRLVCLVHQCGDGRLNFKHKKTPGCFQPGVLFITHIFCDGSQTPTWELLLCTLRLAYSQEARASTVAFPSRSFNAINLSRSW